MLLYWEKRGRAGVVLPAFTMEVLHASLETLIGTRIGDVPVNCMGSGFILVTLLKSGLRF